MKSGKKIEFAPYCYLVPSMLIFAVFLFYPFFKTIYLSLFMTNKMGQAKLFVGLQNYIDLLSSKSFQKLQDSIRSVTHHSYPHLPFPALEQPNQTQS